MRLQQHHVDDVMTQKDKMLCIPGWFLLTGLQLEPGTSLVGLSQYAGSDTAEHLARAGGLSIHKLVC